MPEVTCPEDARTYMVEIIDAALCPDPDGERKSDASKQKFDTKKIMAKHKGCTKALIANNAEEVTRKMNELRALMNRNEEAFNNQISANQKSMKENFAKFLGALKEGFTPLTLNLIAGKGTDADGSLIEGECSHPIGPAHLNATLIF